MRRRWSIVTSATVALLIAACAFPRAAAPLENQDEADMTSLEISVKPEHPEYLSGEAMTVHVSLENKGDAVVEVPGLSGLEALEYTLRPTSGKGPFYVVDFAGALTATDGEPPKPSPVKMVRLEPGDSATTKAEIAGYSAVPFAAGEYHLTVTYRGEGELHSPPATVRITAPRVERLAVTPSPTEGALSLLIAHRTGEGAAIYQIESTTGKPGSGVFHRRHDAPKAESLTGIATAIEATPNRGERWSAYLTDDDLAGWMSQYASVFGTVDATPIGLLAARLHPVGWQPTQTEAVFLAIGIDMAGTASVAAATMNPKEITSATVALDARAVPELWAARAAPGEPGQFDLVWVETAGDTTRLVRQTFTPGDGKAEKRIVLLERDEPLAAFALDPAAGSGPAVVDALFGPVTEDEKDLVTLLRIPLDGGEPSAEWTLDVPRSEEDELPSAFALAPQALPDPGVFALVGERLVFRTVGGGSWRTVADPVLGAAHLGLVVVGEVTWAIWADPVSGVLRVPVAGAGYGLREEEQGEVLPEEEEEEEYPDD